MKDRPNPKGLSRDQGSSQIEKIGDGRYRLFAVNPTDAAPIHEEVGELVKDWSAIHNIWTSDRYTSTDIIYARVRPWRFFQTAPLPVAAGRREGFWVPDYEVEVALTLGAVTTGRAAHPVWETRGAEKMYLQVVEIVNENDGTDITWWQDQMYGYMREDMDIHGVVVNSPNAGDGGGIQPVEIVEQALPMAREDTIYSNAFGEFVVTITDSDTLVLHDLPIPVSGSQILGIVAKTPGVVNSARELYRGAGLQCLYTVATGALDAPGFAFAAGDEVSVYIEGPPKTIDAESHARRTRNVNPDSMHVALDGEFLDGITVADQTTDYYEFNMLEDGYNMLSAYIALGGTVTMTLEATDSLERDATATWSDVTSLVFGITGFSAATTGMYTTTSPLPYRRCRWAVVGDGAGTTTVHMARAALGAPRVQHTAQGDTVATFGVPNLLETKTYDGAAFPNSLANEGRSIRPAASLGGVQFTMPVYQDGVGTPMVRHDGAISAANGGTYGFMTAAEARAVQAAAVAAADSSRLMSNLYGELITAAYEWATQADRTEESDPIDTRDVPDISIDGGAVAAGTTYDYYVDMAHMKFMSIHWEPADANNTLTVEATNQDDGTDPGSCNYFDVTSQWFGVASSTAAVFWEVDTPTQCKWVHIQIVRAGGAGASTQDLFVRKCY